MNIYSAKMIYFSPTGTTRRVVEAIAKGLQPVRIEQVDLTPPPSKRSAIAQIDADLTIIGSPVYAGRLPQQVVARLSGIRGNQGPAVLVVTYGNRAYEDALRELNDLASECGFKAVAAAAFIGEHSYSTDKSPIAAGRPDEEDLRKARTFGQAIREKMRSAGTGEARSLSAVPGNFPYKERSALSGISPATIKEECSRCGACEYVCPTAAITLRGSVETDASLCIRCCACVKACTSGARTMEEPRIRQVAGQLSINCKARKEPEVYL